MHKTHSWHRAARLLCVMLLGALTSAYSGWAQEIPLALRFSDALRIAENGNPEFLLALRGEAIADAKLLQARTRENPVADIESDFLYSAIFPSGQPRELFATLAHVSQEIETSGKRRSRVRLETAGVEAARARISNVRRTLYTSVGTAYLTLARGEADYWTLHKGHQQISGAIDLVAEQVTQGEIAENELLQLQLEQVQLEDQLLQVSLQIRQARISLLALLGASDVDQPILAADSLEMSTLADMDGTPIATPDGVVYPTEHLQNRAILHRPDLKAMTSELEQARANVAVQRALRVPNFSVSVGVIHTNGGTYLDYGLAVPIPVWNRLDRQGLTHAQSVQSATSAAVLQTQSDIKAEVSLAVIAAEGAARRVRLLDDQLLTQLEELYRRSEIALTLGEISLADLIALQQRTLEAHQLRNEAVFEYRISLVNLATTIGIKPVFGEL